MSAEPTASTIPEPWASLVTEIGATDLNWTTPFGVDGNGLIAMTIETLRRRRTALEQIADGKQKWLPADDAVAGQLAYWTVKAMHLRELARKALVGAPSASHPVGRCCLTCRNKVM